MRNDLLSGSPREIVEKAIFLRVSGYSDDDLLALALFEARRIYAEKCAERGVVEYAVPFLLRDLAAGVRHMETGDSGDAALADHAKRIEALERCLCFDSKPTKRRSRPINPEALDLFKEGGK